MISLSLSFCERDPPVTGEFPSQLPALCIFDDIFVEPVVEQAVELPIIQDSSFETDLDKFG